MASILILKQDCATFESRNSTVFLLEKVKFITNKSTVAEFNILRGFVAKASNGVVGVSKIDIFNITFNGFITKVKVSFSVYSRSVTT